MRSMLSKRLVGAVSGLALLVAVFAAADGALASRDVARGGPGFPLSVTTVISGSSLSHTLPGGSKEALTQPDDLASLGGVLYVVFQNGVGPAGTPSTSDGNLDSTVVGFTPGGKVVAQWDVAGHADGLAADPANGRLIVTVNEDGNSSLYTIEPGAAPGAQVQNYSYNLNPLPHGGGTDAVSIFDGQLLISASAPTATSGPALYTATLSGTTAVLQPVFFDTSPARIANIGPGFGQSTTLGLSDPDSNEVVPPQAPRFGGDFVLDSQGDQQQIYLRDLEGSPPALALLNLSQSINDTAWATDPFGTLYVSDNKAGDIVAVRGFFLPGTPFVAVTPCDANNATSTCPANYLGVLNMFTGAVGPVPLPAGTTLQPAGLLFVGNSQDEDPGAQGQQGQG